MFLGIDTSNYTTSIASISDNGYRNVRRILPVSKGSLGLRQSDAVFAHIKALPELVKQIDFTGIRAVGVSTRPRAIEGSYMPCFLAGVAVASAIANSNSVPLFEFSHQQGHIAAILCSSGHEKLLDEEFLAWHLSGGTTELLRVNGQECEIVGGTTDISAGQLIDRVGGMLGLGFPCGGELDSIYEDYPGYRVKVNNSRFSLSGIENKARELIGTIDAGKLSGFTINTVAYAVMQATGQAGKLPVVMCGGVSSNSALRLKLKDAIFGEPEFSCDNAFGIAALARRSYFCE